LLRSMALSPLFLGTLVSERIWLPRPCQGVGDSADGITGRKHDACPSVVKIPVVDEVRITR
jgi:hypothetical protein